MSTNEEEKLDRIEKLKNKLFSRGYETQSEHNDNFSFQPKTNVVDSWQGTPRKAKVKDFFMKTSVFKKFFIFSIVFFVLALGYVSYMFFAGGNTVSNENIEINVLGNTFTAGGEKLPLIIEIVNKNTTALDLVDLVVEYPKGSTSGIFPDTERLRSSLGTIGSGTTRSENLDLVLFGEQGTVRNIKISLEYRIEGSNAIFVKEKEYEVSINSTPIDLIVDAPAEVTPNQDIVFKVKTTLNATRPASKILVKLNYPVGFQFVSANPKPSYDNNVWDLGEMTPGLENTISITGKMVDVYDGDEKTFNIFSGLQSEEEKSEVGIIFNSIAHKLVIKKPFIEAKLFVNSSYQREYAINSKDSISGQVQWKNNLDTKVNDLSIIVRVSGNAFDRKTIKTNSGYYNSAEDYLIWDKNTISELGEVSPGEAGSVVFTVLPVSLYSATSGLMPNPRVDIEVSITGKQALEGNLLNELKNSESKTIRIASDIGITAKALHFSGPFKNTGPMPPRADQKTTYTIVWSLSNTANNVSKGVVRSTIPQWMEYVGNFSPSNENITYNSETREITWNVGAIPRGTGITTSGREVAFQVALTPSISQIDTRPVLINTAVLTGHDDFANVDLRAGRPSLNTSLGGDPLFLATHSKVVE